MSSSNDTPTIEHKAGTLFEYLLEAELPSGEWGVESKIASVDSSGAMTAVATVTMSDVEEIEDPDYTHASVGRVPAADSASWSGVLYWDAVFFDLNDATVRVPTPTVMIKVKRSPTNAA